jgi:dipeptidyl aminopeptidase/acylaminoacyl peptidase
MKSNVVIAVLTMLFVSQPGMADKHAFTIKDLYQLKSVSDPQISPDGKTIAFVVTAYCLEKGTSNQELYLMDAQGGAIRPITSSDKQDYHPRWSPDGRQLMFVSDRTDTTQVWLLPADMGEAKQLTDISTGVSDPRWSPDGKSILFASDVYPECGADDKTNKKINDGLNEGPLQAHMSDALLFRHWNEYRDGKVTHTLLMEVDSGEIRDLTPGAFNSPPFSLGEDNGYALSPDGRELCFVSKRVKYPAESTNNDVFIVPTAGGDPVNITAANEAYDGDVRYSPDGRFIAYRTQRIPGYESDRFRLAIYDRRTRETTVLTEHYDNNIAGFGWAPDSASLYAVTEERGYAPLYRVRIPSGDMTRIANVNGLSGVTVSPDGQWVAYTDRRVGKPLELYRASVTGDEATQLTFVNQSAADAVDIRSAEQMWVEGTAGRKIHVFIVKPHNFDPGKKYPLIVNVHGGPQMQWSDSFRGDWQVYPGAGYVVAFPNPHGSTGYGQAFTAAISRDWAGQVIDDVMQVTRHLAGLNYIDADRIGAMGWSWGGYAINWLQGHNDDGLFKCLITMMGVYDLRSMYSSTEELWFPQWDLGGTPWDSAIYQTMSPSNYVKHFKTPMLVITGERDYRVPYTQSLELFTDLQKMRVPSRIIVFKNDGHWPNFVKSMPFYYNAHLDWFHTYLGGAPAPYDMTQMWRNSVFNWKDEADSEKPASVSEGI